jgi:anti-sigma B factor antagonist
MISNFSKEIHEDIIVEIVELSRATVKESQEFKNILLEDMKNNFLKFVVDFEDCEFIDSTFLSTLVTTLKLLIQKSGNLKLSSISSEVQSLLELTGTHRVFEIYRTKEEAVQSYLDNN